VTPAEGPRADVRLTVCIPCYSADGEAIAAAAQSAATQLPERSELIVVPSGPASAITAELALPAITRVTEPTEPPGLVHNFNRCLALAAGDLIHILHSDDTVAPGFYAIILRLAEQYPDAAMYATGFRSDRDVAASTHEAAPQRLRGADAARFLLADERHAAGNVVLTRRAVERLGAFREEYSFCPDEEAYLRWATLGGVAFDPVRLYVERTHAGQARLATWRHPDFVRTYVAARAAGARLFDERVGAIERASTERRLASVAVSVAQADPAVALALLTALEEERPESRRSRRVRLARLAARRRTVLRALLWRRRLKAALRRVRT